MKLRKLLLPLMLLISLTVFSQTYEWAKHIGGVELEKGWSIAVDESGNVYTTGFFAGTADFDPGVANVYLTSTGESDIFIQKMDASGNFVWARKLGGTNYDKGYSISVDGSGNVYTTGFFSGTSDFDPGTSTVNLVSDGGWDIFVSKLDASGNYVWAKQMGGADLEFGRSITTDNFGNVFITGRFNGTVDFNPGAGTANLTSAGDADIFIQKMDTAGNFIWAKQMGDTDYDIGYAITVDDFGYIYTTGYFRQTVDFDPGPGTANLTFKGADDIFIQKMDTAGNFIWAKQMGNKKTDIGTSIAVDASGNVYTTGFFKDTVDFDPGAGTSYLFSTGLTTNIFIQKLDAAGNFLWAKQMGGVGGDHGYCIALDTFGNIYTIGNFEGIVDFDPGVGSANLTSAGTIDAFIQKLDSAGNFIWVRQLKGNDIVDGRSIAIDASGNAYCTGYFAGVADFDPDAATVNLTSAGSYDIFVQKMNQPTSNITENQFENEIVIFPNPTNGDFSLDLDANHEKINIIITDINGKIIKESTYHQSQLVNLRLEAPSGAYFLIINSEKEQIIMKLIKN